MFLMGWMDGAVGHLILPFTEQYIHTKNQSLMLNYSNHEQQRNWCIYFFNYEWLGNEWHISDTGLFFMNAHIWTRRAKEFLEAWS